MEEKIRKEIEELKYYLNNENKSDKTRKLVFIYDEVLEQKIKLLESLLGE